ncbi:hypothetical protein IGI66_003728 [Enterococcus sp. AZ048]|uniref:hypothetical protein n=1 Tax=Enterococcus sp. AZ048 TaxID=2774658 RepID=UPI003F25DD7F
MYRCKYCNLKLIMDGLSGYYCKECDLYYEESEVIKSRRELVQLPELSNDPFFFQYVTTKDLLKCKTIELLKYLDLARGTSRKLKEKAHHKPTEIDQLDKDNLKLAKRTIHKIETILIERNGYFPAAVYPATIEKEYDRLRDCQRSFVSKGK